MQRFIDTDTPVSLNQELKSFSGRSGAEMTSITWILDDIQDTAIKFSRTNSPSKPFIHLPPFRQDFTSAISEKRPVDPTPTLIPSMETIRSVFFKPDPKEQAS